MIRFNDFVLKNGEKIQLSVDNGNFVFFTGDFVTEVLELFYFNHKNYPNTIQFDSYDNLIFGKDIVYISDEVPLQINRKVLYSFKLPYYLYSSNNRIFKNRLYKILSQTSILNKLDDYIYYLSPKELREVLFFRALINNPDLVIIDNFFSDIPDELYIDCLKNLSHSGVTILMSGAKFIYNSLKDKFNIDLVEI